MGRIAIPIHTLDGGLVAYADGEIGDLEALPEGENKYKLPTIFRKTPTLYSTGSSPNPAAHRDQSCEPSDRTTGEHRP